MRATAFALAALAIGAAQPAVAADAGPGPANSDAMFQIMGPATCAQWPKSGSITSAGKAVPLNWTLGFLSGWASLGKLDLLTLIDPEQVNEWMTKYCADHPTVSLPLAARQLERELEAKLPAPVAAAPPAQPMFLPTNPTPEGLAAANGGMKPTVSADKPAATKAAPARRPAARRRAR